MPAQQQAVDVGCNSRVMEILKSDNYNIVHLTDGKLIDQAVRLINKGEADGINFNFIKNFLPNIDKIKSSPKTKYIQINDYADDFDYSAINYLSKLEHLSVYTTDKKEINYLNYPALKSAALFWRPKAKSLFQCQNLESLFIGKYTELDLSKFEFLKGLKYLRINTGSIKTLKGIGKLQNLETLILSQPSKLEDISGIEELQNLRLLRLDNCRNIKNIYILNNIKTEVRLEIGGTTPTLNPSQN